MIGRGEVVNSFECVLQREFSFIVNNDLRLYIHLHTSTRVTQKWAWYDQLMRSSRELQCGPASSAVGATRGTRVMRLRRLHS